MLQCRITLNKTMLQKSAVKLYKPRSQKAKCKVSKKICYRTGSRFNTENGWKAPKLLPRIELLLIYLCSKIHYIIFSWLAVSANYEKVVKSDLNIAIKHTSVRDWVSCVVFSIKISECSLLNLLNLDKLSCIYCLDGKFY